MNPNEWILCNTALPENGVVVETKIDDERGRRNETTLKLLNGLWFTPDGNMYVYYHPTHWRPLAVTVEPALSNATPRPLTVTAGVSNRTMASGVAAVQSGWQPIENCAAAEPPEARAATFFEPLGYCVHSVTQADCGSCCRRILADLQRQLDEARQGKEVTGDSLQEQKTADAKNMFGVALAVAGVTAIIIAIILGLTTR